MVERSRMKSKRNDWGSFRFAFECKLSGIFFRVDDCCGNCCCGIDAWGIALNMLLQDAPFLAFRLLIIIHYKIISYMNVFFTCKYLQGQ